jgi:hypothetical protein
VATTYVGIIGAPGGPMMRGRPGEEILQFRCRLKLMLCHGHYRRGLEEDAAVLVLPHQVSLIWLARQHDAPLIVGLDECGV